MQTYRYKGFDAAGKSISGEIAAMTVEEVERRLSHQNVTPTSIAPIRAKKAGHEEVPSERRKKRGKVSDVERAAVLRDLATMVEAGVPFVEALEAVTMTKPKPAIEQPLQRIRSAIVAGGSISTAMRQSGDLFPPLVADVINVAERGGKLDNALDNAAGYLERAADLRKKVSNAAVYPTVMLSISGLMMIVIVVFVLPRFGDLFTKMKADVPATTHLMLAVGQFVQKKPLLGTGLFLGSIAAIVTVFRQPFVKKAVAAGALKLPGIGDLLIRLAMSRSLRVISTLLGSNVSIIAALEHGANVAGVRSISKALNDASEMVRQGGTLSDAMKKSKHFPSSVTQMVVVGERTGRLSTVLAACAAKMESDADARLKSLVSIVEPAMILVMGVLVGGITVSIISPIYSAVQNVR